MSKIIDFEDRFMRTQLRSELEILEDMLDITFEEGDIDQMLNEINYAKHIATPANDVTPPEDEDEEEEEEYDDQIEELDFEDDR